MNNFTYCYREPFFQNWPGRIISILIVIVRDCLTLFIQIVLSIYSILLFKRYLNDQLGQLNEYNSSSQILNKIEEYNDNLTKMTLYLSLCSILCNFIIGFGYVMVSFNTIENMFVRLIIFLANLFGILKYFSNFFLFYHFNKTFRAAFFHCFRNDDLSDHAPS